MHSEIHEDTSNTPQTKITQDSSQNLQIISLTRDKNDLNRNVGLWNTLYIIALVFALVVGGFSAFAQLKTVVLSKRLVSVQEQIESEKDRQAALDLGAVQGEAAKANERAANANKAAGDANAEAGKANERAGNLEKDAEDLRKANLDAAKNLEDEKGKRVALAVSLLPRTFKSQTSAIKAMAEFSNCVATFEYLDESEPRETAEQINFVLVQSGWRTEGRPTTRPLFGAVEILYAIAGAARPTSTTPEAMAAWYAAEQAARVQQEHMEAVGRRLKDFLDPSGITVITVMNSFEVRAPNALLIRVGPKMNSVLADALRELGEQHPSATYEDQGNRMAFR